MTNRSNKAIHLIISVAFITAFTIVGYPWSASAQWVTQADMPASQQAAQNQTLGGTPTGAQNQTLGGTPTGAQNQTLGGTPTAGQTTTAQPTQTLQNPLCGSTNSATCGSIGGLIETFTTVFSYIVVLFAVLAIIWVGLQFILAQGNPTKLQDCKRWLTWIVIGVAVVIGARIIVEVVINTLSAAGVSSNVTQSAQSALNAQNTVSGN